MRSPFNKRFAAIVLGLTVSACDAPERSTRGVGFPVGPKDDNAADSTPSEDGEAPVFLLPAESEQTVVLGSGQCAQIDMELSDDGPELKVEVDVPDEIVGATLTLDAKGFVAHWRWCPGAFGELPKPGDYEVVLLADDGTALPTARPYDIIVAPEEPGTEPEDEPEDKPEDCSEGWPTIEYNPAEITAEDRAAISALLKDDEGVVGFPIVEYTFTPPGEEGIESTELIPMELVEGDRKTGLWRVEIPMQADTLYYRFIASDGLPQDACEHLLEEPAEGYLEVTRG